MPQIKFSRSSPLDNIRQLYIQFEAPISLMDCGKQCAPYNPSGKPFCCDICHAVPAAYDQEWNYLEKNTDIWHKWQGNECNSAGADDREQLLGETPAGMILLACLGPDRCQRPYRALSCRQFPFFPYITSDERFLGLAYEWEFENTCWVISNLDVVSSEYLQQFVDTHDKLFSFSMDAFESYLEHSEKLRQYFIAKKRRIPLLHRNGNKYLVSPTSERLARINPDRFPHFGPYKNTGNPEIILTSYPNGYFIRLYDPRNEETNNRNAIIFLPGN